jgi:ABC-type lipoprotein export system ATPase subunit
MLTLNGISKSFIQRGIVLENLGLEISENESLSISGPSGSGKTTLMNIIGLLDRPDSGEILFRGEKVTDYSPDQAARYRNLNIGFVFQESLLLPHLTVIENIVLPLFASATGNIEYDEAIKWAGALMERTGISQLRDKYPFTISGGEAQRVSLVRALIRKPPVLLADEPTGSLDQKNSEILGDLLTEINRDLGIAVVVTTHSSALAMKMKRNLRIVNGRLES